MAEQQTARVVIKNLPEGWTPDHLLNFVEVVTPLTVADNGIQVFKDITHTALLTLEEPVSVEVVRQAEQDLSHMPFMERTLVLKAVTGTTCSVLIHYTNPDLSHYRLLYYFNNPQRSGCGEGEVEHCEIHPEVLLAVVQFSLPEAVSGVLAKGDHIINAGGEAVQVEPWYEQFHRPLLQQLLTQRELDVKPVVPSKPSQRSPEHHKPSQSKPATPPKAKTTCYQKGGVLLDASQHSASETRDPKSRAADHDVEELMAEMEKLRLENAKLKSTEAEGQDKAPIEALQQQLSENERLKSENEKLKKLSTVRLPVPAYQLDLLQDFADQWQGCQVTFLKQEGAALFYGSDEDCEEAKHQFLKRVQNLADDSLPVSAAISKMLKTSKGRRYLDDIIQKYPRCSATVQNTCIFCASVDEENLQALKKEFETNIMSKTCKVPTNLLKLPQFQALKLELENDYLVTMTFPFDGSDDVQLDGFKGDVELAASEVDRFTSKNRPERRKFRIPGTQTGTACKKWFSRELDEVKEIILKNGKIDEETTDGGYTLAFQCRQEVLGYVMEKLNVIKDGIISVNVDLNKEFPLYSERALVINGLYSMGVRAFCSQLAQKLMEQGLDSLGDFRLPKKCRLPQFRLRVHKGDRDRTGKSAYREQWSKSRDRGTRHRSHHLTSQPPSLPYSVTVGNTNITVKLGDITAEQVDAAVCVVGKDLNLKGTAIGSAFLKKCPSVAQALQAGVQSSVTVEGCQMITTAVPAGTLPMSVLFHAVLNKMPRHDVTESVKQLVQQSLQFSVQKGLTAIALPPLGVGRRFGYGRYTVASAMMSAFQEFLQAKPNTLQRITVVVYDKSVAGKFAEVLTQKLGKDTDAVRAVPPTVAAVATAGSLPTVTSEEEADDSTDSEHGDSDTVQEEEEEVPDFTESPTDRFEAVVCTTKAQDCKEVIDILLKELKTIFLWHETIHGRDVDTFKTLGVSTTAKISKAALKASVHLSMSGKGLRMCGQKDKVHELLWMIRSEMPRQVVEKNKEGSSKRQKLGLPVDTDRLPSYWKVCGKEKDGTVSYKKALESWSKRHLRLNSVSAAERAAVEKLVQSTWEASKAGAGADARNLAHTAIQLTKVERLENPEMWREYSHRREGFFQYLEFHHRGSSAASCTPVESLPQSRGPVQTTANITKGSPLCRDIYPQVNEHYLFHGTKREALTKIYRQGLDFRVASDRTMLGPGVYAAESSTKADQYADPKRARSSGEELTMILMRVLLGEPFLHTEQNPSPFKRPPCMSCCKQQCSCDASPLFDSIIDDSIRIFREFVVYDRNVCYPEYFITYKRM